MITTLNGKKLPQLAIERLEHNGAIIRAKTVKEKGIFCSCHPQTELDETGECCDCYKTEQIIGADIAEARAFRLAEIQAEIDDDSTLEENIIHY